MKEHYRNWLKDELEDVEKYAEASKTASGHEKQMLHDMAKEEMEHACAVWHMMECHHMTDDMDKHEVFHKANHVLHD